MDEYLQRLLNAISDAYDKTAGYIVYDLMAAVAIVLQEHGLEMDDLKRLLDVNNLTGDMLDTYIEQRKGMERNSATRALGEILATGNGTITIGDLFETKSGIQFESTETKVIAGSGLVAIRALIAGTSGVVPAAQITMMPVTIPGITAVTNPEPTHDGYDEETDDSYRSRYYIAVRTPPTSGNVYHYTQWAQSFAGVGGVRVLPLERGDNTVEVVLIDQQKQPASPALVDAVQTFIDPDSEGLGLGEAPIGAYCYVVSAVSLEIDVAAEVTIEPGFTLEQVQSNIEDSITLFLQSIAFVQTQVSHAAIGNAVFESEGVADYSGLTINGGTANIPIAIKQVAILGAVTIE